jgi:hypothetical protein
MKTRAKYNRFMLFSFIWMSVASAYAQESVRYPVILSSRWFHPTSPKDTLSTIRMVELYHPDRIDWMYCTDAKQLAQLQVRKVPYSLAINPQVPDSMGYTVHGRIEDINGNKLTAPWMRNWKQKNSFWGCVNAPKFQEVFNKQSRKLIDLGAYGLFVDDARVNDHAVEWGGCYCDYCIKGFTEYLQAHGADTLANDFNYRTFLHKRGIEKVSNRDLSIPLMQIFQRFQTASVLRFLKEWRAKMEEYAKRPLTFLTNNYAGEWSDIYQVFDVGLAELPPNKVDINYIRKQVALATKLRKRQYFTLSSDDESLQLKALYFTYAAGSALIIPWDVYVNAKSKQKPFRFFGRTDAFQTAYALFRQSAPPAPAQFRSARQAESGLTFTPTITTDSIHTHEYESTSRRIVLIEAQSPKSSHSLTVKNGDQLILEDIQVMYPEAQAVRIRQRPHRIDIEYKSNFMVLSLPLN